MERKGNGKGSGKGSGKGGCKGGACYTCGGGGHLARDCPHGGKSTGKGYAVEGTTASSAAAAQAATDITSSVVASLLWAGPVAEEAARAEVTRQQGGPKGERARVAMETLQILEND